MSQSFDRRSFLGAAGAGLGYFYTARASSAARLSRKPNETLRFAGIGVGGKGSSDIDQAGNLGEVIALCDIDGAALADKRKRWPDAKTFTDFRKLYDQVGKQIDAVTVSTPDHTHALAALIGIRMGKHVYCQKPLTHSVFEARVLQEAAKKAGVCTQMGNQGSAENGLRRAVELIQGGLLGKITEAHVWTNRPVWPQAPDITARPDRAEIWPASIDWDCFIGGAPLRPYISKVYHPFNWRGWWDYGTGAIGDMACHTANMAFRALKLGHPYAITAESGELNPETYPAWARVVLEFPARDEMPPVKLTWYEGKKDGVLVLPPRELLDKVLRDGEKLKESGSILVGEKGILYSPDDYGAEFRLTPDKLAEGVNLTMPEQLPSNGQGDQGMKNEWVAAIKAGKPELAYSNFDTASLLTEAFLLGNVAIKTGKRLEWDGPGLRVLNVPEADALIKTEYRRGWEVTRG
ncbi:MAG: Gfo/Idh/MocA family oxidoreductase [Isosphaeraceae bacterium]|nr:Gfo/Idh/MocA family oxidoreductase [Isosphaeraceae bacterium]